MVPCVRTDESRLTYNKRAELVHLFNRTTQDIPDNSCSTFITLVLLQEDHPFIPSINLLFGLSPS